MEKITIREISTLKNNGQKAQQNIDYYYTKRVRVPDSVRFDKGADIPEICASVKSNHFTLCSAHLLQGETLAEMVADYMRKVYADKFIYVINDNVTAYIMNADEFRAFCLKFCKLEKDSPKNGARVKVRCNHESEKTRAYLESLTY